MGKRVEGGDRVIGAADDAAALVRGSAVVVGEDACHPATASDLVVVGSNTACWRYAQRGWLAGTGRAMASGARPRSGSNGVLDDAA